MDINLLLEPRGSGSPAGRTPSSEAAGANTIAPFLDNTSSAAGGSPAYSNGSARNETGLPQHSNVSRSARASTSAPPIPDAKFGGPVLPAISEVVLPAPHPQFPPLGSGPLGFCTTYHGATAWTLSPQHQGVKRNASQASLPDESPAKKQSKWTPEEDALVIELRGQGMKWDDIAKRLPGRSPTSCRLHYQNYLEKRIIWDDEKKSKLAGLYARLKEEMWRKAATEMGIPWRSVESMHWQLGEHEMSARANVSLFQLHPSATSNSSPSQSVVASAREPVRTKDGSTPISTAQLMADPLLAPAGNIKP